MGSRVVHVRLDDWVLLGCHDILKEGGKSTDNLPMSTIVRETLSAFIRKMQQSEHIPTYSREDLINRIHELQEKDVLDTPAIDPREMFIAETEDKEDMSVLAAEVLREIEKEGEPVGIGKEVHISEADVGRGDEHRINLFDVNSKDFTDIRSKAPKDRLVEWADGTDNEVIQKAVAIVYSNLPQSQWGTVEAEENVSRLCKMHLGNAN